MDSQNKNNTPLPEIESHRLSQKTINWLTGLALTATLAVGATHTNGAEPHFSEALKFDPAATLVIPELDQLPALERSYTRQSITQPADSKRTKGGPEYSQRLYDEKVATESMVVYRHEGLDGMSFARPSLEVNQKILDADSVDSLEASVAPFFTSLGMNLYMTKAHPEINNDVVELEPEDLEETRVALLATLNEIAITPLEVIKFANVTDVVFGHDLRTKKGAAGGLAYFKSKQPGIIALDSSDGDSTWRANVWNHELGHHIAHALDEASGGTFSKEFARLNAPQFTYKNQLLIGDAVDIVMQRGQRQKALAESDIISDYSAESVGEDVAETYRTFWREMMAPDENDTSYGKLLGAKRVLLMESINRAVPGFKAYMIGLANTGIYTYEHVSSTQESLDLATKNYGR